MGVREADLSPPLGFPGGPCHVVQRIDEEVRNPRMRDTLTDKVEHGEKLTNPEAAKVYSIETDRGGGLFKTIKITPPVQRGLLSDFGQYRLWGAGNSGVYAIRNSRDNKVYVGQSVEMGVRLAHHRRLLRRGVHTNPHFQNAWNRDGEEAFGWEVLAEAPASKLASLEGRFCADLRALDRHFGYNIEEVDLNGNYTKSEEHRRKISKAHLGKKQGPPSAATRKRLSITMKLLRQGADNPAYGKPASNRVAVHQMSLEGELLAVWSCIREAAEAVGRTRPAISNACRGRTATLAGFCWQYADVLK